MWRGFAFFPLLRHVASFLSVRAARGFSRVTFSAPASKEEAFRAQEGLIVPALRQSMNLSRLDSLLIFFFVVFSWFFIAQTFAERYLVIILSWVFCQVFLQSPNLRKKRLLSLIPAIFPRGQPEAELLNRSSQVPPKDPCKTK